MKTNSDRCGNRPPLETAAPYAIACAGSGGTLNSSWAIQPIFDSTLTQAATSITTSGTVTLDGNTHGGYEFELWIYNPTLGTVSYSMYFNNDTTAGNYTTYAIVGGATNPASGVSASDAVISAQTTLITRAIKGSIMFSPGGQISAEMRILAMNLNNVIIRGLHKNATVTNLTRVDVVSDAASGIGINSRFRLWRMK